MSSRKEAKGGWYLVYQDLNEPAHVFVARADEVVTGTFRRVAGPFEHLADAQRAAKKAQRGAKR